MHVIPSLAAEDGGPARAMLEMERGLVEAGIEVTTVTTLARKPEGLPVAAARVRRVGVRRIANPYKLAPALASVLPKLVQEHDVVHAHALFSFAPNLAAFAARAYGVPYVMRPLGTLAPYGLRRRAGLKRLSMACIEGPLLRSAAAVHFTSSAEQEEARLLKLPMREAVIPLGIHIPPSQPVQALEHPALAGRIGVLFLSRLDPKKNLEALIDAVAGSPDFLASAALVVAGDGPADYVEQLKTRAINAGIGDRVVWLGHVDGAQKAAAFAAAHVFVLPSLSENFGIAAVEALASGLPCVLADGVAVAGDVAEAGAGLVVPSDAAAIRAALDQLVASPAMRETMGRNARALASERYSAAAMTRRLVALYEEISAARASGRR